MAAAAAGTAAIGYSAIRKNLQSADPKTYQAIKRIQDRIAEDKRFAASVGGKDIDLHAISEADQLLTAHIVECWPIPKKLAKLAADRPGFPKAVAAHVLGEIAGRTETRGLFDPDAEGYNKDARDFAHAVVVAALEASIDEEGYFRTLEPHLLIEQLGLTVEIATIVEKIADNMTSFGPLLSDIKEDVAETKADVKKILAILSQDKSGPEDAQVEETLKATLARLLNANQGARKRAADYLTAAPPDPGAALRELRQLAAQQEAEVGDAAETYREIATLTYYNDGTEALAALRRVSELSPEDMTNWNQLGLLCVRLGLLSDGDKAFQVILNLASQSHDKSLLVVAYGNLGIVEYIRGNLDAAVEYYQHSLALNEELGRKEGMASDYGNLGIVEQTRGNLDAACQYWHRARDLFAEIGAEHKSQQVQDWIDAYCPGSK